MNQAQSTSALAGRTAVVTGGSRGIGRTIGRLLSEQQVQVLLVAREARTLEPLARELGVAWFAADVTEAAAVERLEQETSRRWGAAPDLVVQAAGAFALAPVAETTVEAFDQQIAVNLRAVFLVTRAFLPGMLARGSGDIVTVGSIAGRQAFPANGAYSASKFGVRGLHAVLARGVEGHGRTSHTDRAGRDGYGVVGPDRPRAFPGLARPIDDAESGCRWPRR